MSAQHPKPHITTMSSKLCQLQHQVCFNIVLVVTGVSVWLLARAALNWNKWGKYTLLLCTRTLARWWQFQMLIAHFWSSVNSNWRLYLQKTEVRERKIKWGRNSECAFQISCLVFMIMVIINAFLRHQIPLWLYIWKAQNFLASCCFFSYFCGLQFQVTVHSWWRSAWCCWCFLSFVFECILLF